MSEAHRINASSAIELLKSGEALLIDVREPDEFAEEHIAYAISVPLGQVDTALPDLANDKRKMLFHCKLGKRGQTACEKVRDTLLKGHEIFNLEGGIEAWKEAGFPVVKKQT